MKNIRPRNPFLWIKYRLLEWSWDRALERSGCQTWERYFRRYDPDYNECGYTVKEQLFGYPYIALVPYRNLDWSFDPIWSEYWNGAHIVNWCNQNCRGKFRWHWERVIVDHEGQYLPNGIGGGDELFFAFKDERDYILFLLRWS